VSAHIGPAPAPQRLPRRRRRLTWATSGSLLLMPRVVEASGLLSPHPTDRRAAGCSHWLGVIHHDHHNQCLVAQAMAKPRQASLHRVDRSSPWARRGPPVPIGGTQARASSWDQDGDPKNRGAAGESSGSRAATRQGAGQPRVVHTDVATKAVHRLPVDAGPGPGQRGDIRRRGHAGGVRDRDQ
jgi:hypothetical protein